MAEYRVRFVKPQGHYRRIRYEVEAPIAGCLVNGDLICRRQLRDFEAHFAAYAGTRQAVGVNSGCHALALSLPMSAELTPEEVDVVADEIRVFFAD